MLRLKRHPSHTVSIVWRQKTAPSKRLFMRALLYSILIHGLMVVVFHIRIALIEIPLKTPTPTVFLDSEESAVAVLADMRSIDEDPRVRVARELHLSHSSLSTALFAVKSDYAANFSISHSSQPQKREVLPIYTLPWSFSDELSPSRHLSRVYPLTVTLHDALRTLELIEDGSQVFCKASFETVFCTPLFSETHPRVEFKVEVMPSTGEIARATCVRELTDKRLQGVALHLIQCLRFRPTLGAAQQLISGIVSIQFAGTFDTISTLLDMDNPHD